MRPRKRARRSLKSAEVVETKEQKERVYPTPCAMEKSGKAIDCKGIAGRRGCKECARV